MGEEQSVVETLVNAILGGFDGPHHDIVQTMFLNVTKGMACKVPLTILVLIDSELHPNLAALLVAVLY